MTLYEKTETMRRFFDKLRKDPNDARATKAAAVSEAIREWQFTLDFTEASAEVEDDDE